MQYEVDSLLRRGVVFSIVWLMGIGSLYAILCAWRARQLIVTSNGELQGTRRMWWCFIVGGLGVSLWFPVLGALIVDVIRH